MSSRLRFFRWLIFIERWQPRNLSWKAVVMAEEEEGSSNVGCGATSWLQVASATVRVRLQEEEDGAAMYTTIVEEGNSGMVREMVAIVFNLLLAAIKIVDLAVNDCCRLQCKQIERKIVAGSFLSQGLLLAAIKEDGSKRSLLAVLGSKRCMLWLKG
ncbi:hypothetical protein B296_00016155 [Ensete ventricosum]|uniref:Uncharacterized protein n=1 Tax=Ensete ventricosum TaxID=4639 RepID=A0A426ZCU0_ENSVE|nr:hypothetical protein B296_00016155 [Ensete ventricosum]